MDPLLLDYYNRELVFMREKAAAFAEQHPKVAKRLGMQGMDVADPYVERLIEAFCFMSARTQIKLDAEFPQFTQRLLEVIAPNYLSPIPSISVAQFHPAHQQGDLSHGITLPKHTKLRSKVPYGEQVACEFSTGQETTLWPVVIQDINLIDTTAIQPFIHTDRPLKQAIRIRLRTLNNYQFSDIKGLDTLPIYLCGEENMASQLLAYIHTATVATMVMDPASDNAIKSTITHQAVMHDGIHPDQSVLPNTWQSTHGNQLLQEYFACPSRFLFFTLTQLSHGLSQINGQEADIILLCDKDMGMLAQHIDKNQFALYCSPVVNLFSSKIDRVEIDKKHHEFHLVPDRTHPLDYEIYAVENVRAQRPESTETLTFRPLFHTMHQDQGNWGKYFSTRRERRMYSSHAKKYGTRTGYIGSEVFISLVDQQEAPYPEDIRYLSVDALLTNRDLPTLIPRNGKDDLTTSNTYPISAIGLIRPPSKPRTSPAEQKNAWKLIQYLSFHYQSLLNLSSEQRAGTIQQLLSLFVGRDQQDLQQQIQGINHIHMQAVTRRLPGQGPLVFGRGVHYDVQIDETHFSGSSPYLLTFLLAKWLSNHTAINTFAEIALHTHQHGLIHQWPMSILTSKDASCQP